ncbi:hypothetical protein GMORB2_6757 [Geosmithia morbida]|uniref:Large ribosomal subunit protein mL67 n=1 Tax=Geosmithia morbida TaxID=1094350 RepID=A0A9P4YVC4_9HYPO|nr:uncharacterized protein GMORB2_6757 [Geosmithia morbida]KAF4123207.1 hypothetical protein GMORB2_6757 [Geosmithia morbida]
MNSAVPTLRMGQPMTGLPKACVRSISHSSKPRKASTGFVGPPGHGEKIWIWSHRRTDQTIYTLRNRLDIPYNGKKLKPAKLRPDYWSRMATVELPPGQGVIGRSIYQKLRELKKLHELEWDDDIRVRPESDFSKADVKQAKKALEEGREYRPMRSKRERGVALNAQKKNSIADLAAVLAGQGRGNRLVTSNDEAGGEGAGELLPVTVNWANDQDRNYAEEWSSNVTHGLYEEPSYVADEV